MIVIDSNILIDYFNGEKTKEIEILEDLIDDDTAAVTSVVLMETIATERNISKYERIKKEAERFSIIKTDHDCIMLAIEIFRACEGVGKTMKYLDCIIAASCIQYDLPIFSNDSHFEIMAEVTGQLKIYNG